MSKHVKDVGKGRSSAHLEEACSRQRRGQPIQRLPGRSVRLVCLRNSEDVIVPGVVNEKKGN